MLKKYHQGMEKLGIFSLRASAAYAQMTGTLLLYQEIMGGRNSLEKWPVTAGGENSPSEGGNCAVEINARAL